MSISLSQLEQVAVPEIATTIRNAGVSGAGGAGFPAYAKWERLDEVDHLLVNHQESEPNYYMDKWLARERVEDFATLFDALLESALETVVVTPKWKDRTWSRSLEDATDATVYEPDELPIDPDEESGVVFAYTEDKYEFGMESVLLRIVGDTVLGGDDLPMDHGWIVQNTETLYRIYRALEAGEPMRRKFVHVDGNVPRHRFLDVPVGTPATRLLEAAGRRADELGDDEMLLEGGPGWSFAIEQSPREFGVTKRTNAVMVLDSDTVAKNTLGNGRVNIINAHDWDREHETAPRKLQPEAVSVPMITNPSFQGVVSKGQPIVTEGESVESGEMVATPADGISNTHHAPIDGKVSRVTDSRVRIAAEETEPMAESATDETERGLYWTWCVECGSYAPMPDPRHVEGTEFVCDDCRA